VSPAGESRAHFLDGLRGWGAIAVVNTHLFAGFLFNDSPEVNALLRAIPFLFDGEQAVYVFFVLSGFAITIPYFSARRKKLALLDAAVRRYPRLTLPVFASALLAWVLMKAGLMNNVDASALVHSNDWFGTFYLFEPDLVGLLKFSFVDVYADYNTATTYNAVLWTMKIELLGAFFIYGFLALTGEMKHRVMAYLLVGLLVAGTSLLPFVVGCMLSDFYHRTLPVPRAVEPLLEALRRFPRTALWLLVAATTVWTLARWHPWAPSFNLRSPAGMTLVGSALVAAAMQDGPARRFFSSALSRALGRYSFPLYLVHLPILCSWSAWLYVQLRASQVPTPAAIAWVATSSLLLIALLTLLFERLVESPSVSASRWVGKKSSAWMRPDDRAPSAKRRRDLSPGLVRKD
jgi:peptidoglycan/LPS O-acetylase OafA/YrhL